MIRIRSYKTPLTGGEMVLIATCFEWNVCCMKSGYDRTFEKITIADQYENVARCHPGANK